MRRSSRDWKASASGPPSAAPGENAAGLMLALKHSDKIRPVIAKHEQAASFMACGYAMYTDKLGFCFATAGPGAFNLFSGLAVAMSDSYPVLAVSGYASLEWQGKGSLNETSGLNRTPDSQKMFAATTKKSFLLTDIAETCDVLEEAVNIAFEGRPGPVHIHVPENLTHHGVEVENYHDIRLDVTPVLPDPARVEEIASVLADAIAKRKKIVALVGFGAIRSGAGAEVKRLIERFQIPLLTTMDGKGIVSEGHPLSVGLFCDAGHSSAWKAFLEADVVLCIGNSLNQHATFNYREDLFEDKQLIHINISEDEIDKAYKADYAIVSDARPAVAALVEALEQKVGEVEEVDVDGKDYEARHIIHLTGFDSPRRARADDRTDASPESDSARRRRCASGVARVLRRAGGGPELPEGRLVRTDGRTRQRRHRPEDGASRPDSRRRLRRRLLLAQPASS